MPREDMLHLVRRLEQEISSLQKQVKTLQSVPVLRHASIDDTGLPVIGADGRVKQIIGRQADGSYGDRAVQSSHQPRPSAPSLDVSSGAIGVSWDGVADGPVPHGFGRVEVWGAPGESATPDQARHLSSIYSREGGTTAVKATPGAWRFWLRMVGPDGHTASQWSTSVDAEVSALVDEADIRKRLEDFAGGSLDDATYANLMSELAQHLRVEAVHILAGQVQAVHLAVGAVDGQLITGAHIQTHAEPNRGVKILGEESAIVAFDDDGAVSLWLDGETNRFAGTLSVKSSGTGHVEVRPHLVDEISAGLDDGGAVYTGLGFHADGDMWAAGVFIQESTGRLTVTAGTGPGGRPRAWMVGDYSADTLEALDELTAAEGCRVGSTADPFSFLNGWRSPSGYGGERAAHSRLGNMIFLRGSTLTPSAGSNADPIAVLPPPSHPRRVAATHATSSASAYGPVVLEIDTTGELRALDGGALPQTNINFDGCFYYL